MGTGMCVNSRKTGGANVYRDGICLAKKVSKIGLAGLLVILFVATAGIALAELPAPNFMPGFPIVAGPQIILMWQPVHGAAKYKVYVNGVEVAETAAFQHIVPAQTESGVYEFAIAATEADGKPGAKGKPWVHKVVMLAPPKNIIGRLVDGRVSIRWDPVPSAMIYNVYKRGPSEKELKLVGSIQDVSFTDKEVAEGNRYEYAITAKDATGKESERSPGYRIEFPKASEVKKIAYQELVPIGSKVEKLLRSFRDKEGEKPIYIPGGVAVKSGKIYVSEIKSCKIIVFDASSLEQVVEFGDGCGVGAGKIQKPLGLDVDPAGNIFVADAFGAKVLKFAPSGEFVEEYPLPVFTYTDKGKEINQRAGPSDVKVLKSGRLLLVDNNNSRLILLDANGTFLRGMGEFSGKDGFGFARPTSSALDAGQSIYVADSMNGRILVVGEDGKLKRTIGSSGDTVGEFGVVIGVAIDEARKWVVASDSKGGNIQVFGKETGKYLYSVMDEKDPKKPILLSIPNKIVYLGDDRYAVLESLIDKDGGGVKVLRLQPPKLQGEGVK
jgi:DNA-binding beta-propeller fold protein YncE